MPAPENGGIRASVISLPQRPRGFVVSWLFAPYTGSADLDLFKRLHRCELDFVVIQARRERSDLRLLQLPASATFERHEVVLPAGPRTREARDAFSRGAHDAFARLSSKPDVLLSHSNEVPSHRVALELKRLHPELPWVAYFGDVVRRNLYVPLMRDFPLFDEDCETEAQTLALADLVICNNEVQRRWFCEQHPDAAARIVTVAHCFESGWYPSPSVPADSPFTFMHLGALYPIKRRAEPLLLAVELLLEVYPHLIGTFRMVFVGDDVPDDDLAAWRTMRHRDHVEFRPGVPYLDSLALMQRAHVLVIIDGVFDATHDGVAESPYLPGKLADYLGARRPLLAITMEQSPTADVLRARAEPIATDDPERIAFVMKRHLDGRVSSRHHTAARYRAELAGASMELCLRAAISGTSAIKELPRLLRRLTQPIEEAIACS